VHAAVLQGDEHDAAFAEQASRYPGFAGYQSRTERIIPVIALTPIDVPSASTPSPSA
jgi:hypothetical protein